MEYFYDGSADNWVLPYDSLDVSPDVIPSIEQEGEHYQTEMLEAEFDPNTPTEPEQEFDPNTPTEPEADFDSNTPTETARSTTMVPWTHEIDKTAYKTMEDLQYVIGDDYIELDPTKPFTTHELLWVWHLASGEQFPRMAAKYAYEPTRNYTFESAITINNLVEMEVAATPGIQFIGGIESLQLPKWCKYAIEETRITGMQGNDIDRFRNGAVGLERTSASAYSEPIRYWGTLELSRRAGRHNLNTRRLIAEYFQQVKETAL
jgi:hypothetical protein